MLGSQAYTTTFQSLQRLFQEVILETLALGTLAQTLRACSILYVEPPRAQNPQVHLHLMSLVDTHTIFIRRATEL